MKKDEYLDITLKVKYKDKLIVRLKPIILQKNIFYY